MQLKLESGTFPLWVSWCGRWEANAILLNQDSYFWWGTCFSENQSYYLTWLLAKRKNIAYYFFFMEFFSSIFIFNLLIFFKFTFQLLSPPGLPSDRSNSFSSHPPSPSLSHWYQSRQSSLVYVSGSSEHILYAYLLVAPFLRDLKNPSRSRLLVFLWSYPPLQLLQSFP